MAESLQEPVVTFVFAMSYVSENALFQTDSGTTSSSVRGTDFLVSVSPAMRFLEQATREMASSNLPILILGEPGTGKGTLAFRIHQLSSCADHSISEVDCAEVTPDALIHKTQNVSVGESVGTLVLHEISAISAECQVRLLDCLVRDLIPDDEDRRVPRLVFTTHANLDQEVRAGRFREDLYYLISGVCLRMPPLRHRKEDIPVLTDCFLSRYSELLRRPKPLLSGGARHILGEYSWPGNVRELEDTARTIAAVGDERLGLATLKSSHRVTRRHNERGPAVSLKEASRAASRAAEKDLILRVLSRTRWNRKRAAEELKISYKALLYKLKQMGVQDPNATVGDVS